MTESIEAVVEHWGKQTLLVVPSLPGLQVSGESNRECITRAQETLPRFLAWLGSLDLRASVDPDDQIVIAEEQHAKQTTGPRFNLDLPRPADDQIELALAVGRAFISDLIDIADEPTEEYGEQIDRVLKHVATQDDWYAARLGITELLPIRSSAVAALIRAAGGFEDAVDADAGQGPELRVVDGEEWTLAKVLRRRTGHLAEHLAELTAAG